MSEDFKNIAFVLGGSVNSLGVVKALGREKIPNIVINNSDDTIAKFSRYTKFYKSPDPINELDAYIDFLINLQKEYEVPSVLLPTSDVTVIAISKNREILNDSFRFNIPSTEIVDKITSKEGFNYLAQKYRLPVPKSFSIEHLNNFENIIEQLDFPCVIKPYYSHSWRTSTFRNKYGRMQIFRVENSEELLNFYKIFAEYDPRVIVQECIQGNDDCEYSLHTYTSMDGQNIINFLAHKLHLDPIHYGSGAFIQTAHQREIFKTGNDFLKSLSYRGMSSFQFKWDSVRKKFYAIELNPRFSLWNFLEPSCGVNYPYINYLDSLGYDFEVPDDYEDGVKWFSIERDINAFLSYRKEGSLTFWKWIKGFQGKIVCAEFSWDDPIPFFYWLTKKIQTTVRGKMKKFIHLFNRL